ncbi:hypothetical protein CPB86DRAFT_820574 [Serendipita vermifera]|nr:hypothetical protein CPB86DRAFT_820574 [Serendipita vermifera]
MTIEALLKSGWRHKEGQELMMLEAKKSQESELNILEFSKDVDEDELGQTAEDEQPGEDVEFDEYYPDEEISNGSQDNDEHETEYKRPTDKDESVSGANENTDENQPTEGVRLSCRLTTKQIAQYHAEGRCFQCGKIGHQAQNCQSHQAESSHGSDNEESLDMGTLRFERTGTSWVPMLYMGMMTLESSEEEKIRRAESISGGEAGEKLMPV